MLGTPAYMAPEQVRCAVVDKRADIWAFGVLLFEMLAGRRLFGGGTPSDMVASVLMAVTTTFGSDGQSLQLGSPVGLFASRIADPGPARTHLYAVARDGQRFLIEQTTEEGTATLTVVKNWRPQK